MSTDKKGKRATGLLDDKFNHHAHGASLGALSATYLGQAHFADLSSTHRCEECAFWVPVAKRAHRCAKARQLAGRPYPPVPPTARACKYFSARQ